MSKLNFGGIAITSMAINTPTTVTITPEIIREAVRHLHLKTEWKESAWRGNVPFSCPYHKDKTPSMYLHMEKGMYHCFSCNRSGHVSGLYKDITGDSFNQTFSIADDPISNFASRQHMVQYEEEDYSILGRDISIKVEGRAIPIRSSPEAIKYLRKRGIPFDVADSMNMAYMPVGRVNGTMYDKRILIPIYEKGELFGYEGRDVTEISDRKVIYPKDGTSNTLYDMDVFDPDQPLYVVEGLMDLAVLRTDPYFKNSTSIFGAGLTRRQRWLLNQYSHVVMIPDNDKAGQGTLKALTECMTKPFSVLEIPKLTYKCPQTGKDTYIKDVGDIPAKLHTTVKALRKRGWGRTLRSSEEIRKVMAQWQNTQL